MAVLVSNPQLPSASITGYSRVGATLIGNPVANATTTVSYKWLRDGRAITGATQPTYAPTSTDLLKSISLIATVRQSGFPLVTSTSSARVIQLGVIERPELTIAGTATMGNTVLINAQIPAGAKATYQWFRDSKLISGSTRDEYKIKAEDVNTLLTARINLTRLAYSPTTVSSAEVKVNAGELTKTPTPTVSGTAALNKTLSGAVGSWDVGVKFTYQWLRNGDEIPGAIAKTFRITSSDKGKQIVFKIRATKPGYKTVVLSSNSILSN
jgi:hypothetical protein